MKVSYETRKEASVAFVQALDRVYCSAAFLLKPRQPDEHQISDALHVAATLRVARKLFASRSFAAAVAITHLFSLLRSAKAFSTNTYITKVYFKYRGKRENEYLTVCFFSASHIIDTNDEK